MGQPTLVKPGAKVKLADYDPDFHGTLSKSDPEVEQRLLQAEETMCELQERLYAEARQSLLIVLQAMDTAGKDGTVTHVMRGLNPQGCDVVSFKAPTPEDLAHDFLWRVHQRVPGRGCITVFNRSHYEDVLIVRVHDLISPKVCEQRYRQINEFERLLTATGTRMVKFFLFISPDEQKRRLEARLADPTKQWKFNPEDLKERELWDGYIKAYEEALSRCSTTAAPWHIVPANRKWYRNLVVAETIAATLKDMHPEWPAAPADLSSVVVD